MPPSGSTIVDEVAWDVWMRHRVAIRHPIAPDQLDRARARFAAFGAQQRAVVDRSVERGWRGLFALPEIFDPKEPW